MPTSTDPTLADERALRDVVIRMLHAIDARRWGDLPPLFTEEVVTDYTSLFGGEAQRQAASALFEAWRALLTPLDATQHLLGPIAVAIEGEAATAECHVRGYHVAARAPGGPEWMVAGHYVIGLVVAEGRWRIRSLTLETLYQTGNRKLLQEVA